MSISETLLPEFDKEFASTRKIQALVPDDRLAWKPHAKSMEMGRLGWHITGLTGRAVDVLTTGVRTVTAEDVAKRKDAWVGKTRGMILEQFDADLKAAREALASTSDAAWGEPWKLVFIGRAVFDGPRATAYRNMVISHMIHHRAQLGLYLRLNDIAIPGVYGPSADEG
ncbi:MAG TPA: DinB family protein [Acidobacteriaceae bacterium]|nr:DinB family protein [Acidobacteriaceae bacterium]